MGRYARIFLLVFQHVLEYKSRAFVWFLVTLLNATLYLLFWRGAIGGSGDTAWSFSSAMSYYLLLTVVGAFLYVHVEEEVAYDDIQRGWLSRYLTRPFSYYKIKFLEEFPWRFVQGLFGALIFGGVLALGFRFPLVSGLSSVLLALCIVVLGYMLTFTYKMILGLTAFWTTDFSGLHNLEAMMFILLGGFVMPLGLLPENIRAAALIQPIAYMTYYPVMSLGGSLPPQELVRIIGMQCVWIVVGILVYRRMWWAGLRRFTATGQ